MLFSTGLVSSISSIGSVLVHRFGLLLVGSIIESSSVSPIVTFYFMYLFRFQSVGGSCSNLLLPRSSLFCSS